MTPESVDQENFGYIMQSRQMSDVHTYYSAKTRSIIEKFGPGPRIHFHLGLYDHQLDTFASTAELNRRIVLAQNRMIARAAEIWDAPSIFSGKLLDVGCGLGGPAIYWAQTCNVDVTAITLVPEHAQIVARLAKTAGVADLITGLTADACTMVSPERFAAAVAMESICYMRRAELFANMAKLIAPGGYLAVEDVFVAKSGLRTQFDQYWKTQIGTHTEYVEGAEAAGFELDRDIDVTSQTMEFWVQSLAWSEARLHEGDLTQQEQDRLLQSIRWHASFFRGWRDGQFQVRVLRYRNGRVRRRCSS